MLVSNYWKSIGHQHWNNINWKTAQSSLGTPALVQHLDKICQCHFLNQLLSNIIPFTGTFHIFNLTITLSLIFFCLLNKYIYIYIGKNVSKPWFDVTQFSVPEISHSFVAFTVCFRNKCTKFFQISHNLIKHYITL